MGAYSTMTISRKEALEEIKEELENIDNMSNERLADLMFLLFCDRWGANFIITNELGEGNAD